MESGDFRFSDSQKKLLKDQGCPWKHFKRKEGQSCIYSAIKNTSVNPPHQNKESPTEIPTFNIQIFNITRRVTVSPNRTYPVELDDKFINLRQQQ